eukprot:PhM_4_TR16785/c0_g1_i1/m.103432
MLHRVVQGTAQRADAVVRALGGAVRVEQLARTCVPDLAEEAHDALHWRRGNNALQEKLHHGREVLVRAGLLNIQLCETRPQRQRKGLLARVRRRVHTREKPEVRVAGFELQRRCDAIENFGVGEVDLVKKEPVAALLCLEQHTLLVLEDERWGAALDLPHEHVDCVAELRPRREVVGLGLARLGDSLHAALLHDFEEVAPCLDRVRMLHNVFVDFLQRCQELDVFLGVEGGAEEVLEVVVQTRHQLRAVLRLPPTDEFGVLRAVRHVHDNKLPTAAHAREQLHGIRLPDASFTCQQHGFVVLDAGRKALEQSQRV